MTDFLYKLGFHSSHIDSFIFILHYSAKKVYLLIYANDMLIINSSTNLIASMIQKLSCEFSLKILSALHFFLGSEVFPMTLAYFSYSITIYLISCSEMGWRIINQFQCLWHHIPHCQKKLVLYFTILNCIPNLLGLSSMPL